MVINSTIYLGRHFMIILSRVARKEGSFPVLKKVSADRPLNVLLLD